MSSRRTERTPSSGDPLRMLGIELDRPAGEFVRVARAFVARRKRLGAIAQVIMKRLPRTHDAVVSLARGNAAERYRAWVAQYDTIRESDAVAAWEVGWGVGGPPLLSLIVRPGQMDVARIEELVRWLRAQLYESWEAVFVIEPSTSSAVRTLLADVGSREARFAVHGGADASLVDTLNAALRDASGDHAVFVDADVLPRPHALLLFACAVAQNRDTALVYADEDRIDDTGARSHHYFKSDWSEALLCSRNYLGGLVAFSRTQALAAGGFDEELDDEYVWGLALRIGARVWPGAVQHLPFVLTHRPEARAPASATRERAARALEARLRRVGRRARVEPVGDASFRLHYELPEAPPRVTVVIPSACKLEHLQLCLDGLLRRTAYPELEVLLVVNEIRKQVP